MPSLLKVMGQKKKGKRKGEHSYKAVRLTTWPTGVFSNLDSRPVTALCSTALLFSCHPAAPLLWGSWI